MNKQLEKRFSFKEVENEFILPTTTLTRVYAGKTVKTVDTD